MIPTPNVSRQFRHRTSAMAPAILPESSPRTASEAAVRESLGRTGRRFSRDVVAFYCLTGGMEDGDMDGKGLSVWSLDRVVEENRDTDAADLAFADYPIDSWRYSFRFEDETRSSVYGGLRDRRLADSVEQFFGLYLNSPQELDL